MGGDQHAAPTWSRDLVRMTAHVLARAENEPGEALSGTYDAAGSGETTWYGFAAEAVRLANEREPGVSFAQLEAIPTTEYPTPAKRPANSRMSCTKLAERFGWKMMDWRDSLHKVMSEL